MKKKYFPLCMMCLLMLTFAGAKSQDSLTINFMDMTPHVGQNLYLRVVDTLDDMEVGRKSMMVDMADFTVKFGGLTTSHSYDLDFWADLNMNGQYDVPSTDHAWRITIDSLEGDSTITFTHNTDFTDIMWPADDTGGMGDKGLTIAFQDMTPHLNEELYVALKYKNGSEVDRKEMLVTTADFNVNFDSIMVDSSYMIDFWADHNTNGKYDAPPADHAWRIEVDSVEGDTVIPFVHNTDFTDISWMYKLTVNFEDMTPHLNQPLYFYVRDTASSMFVDSVIVDPVTVADFSVYSYKIMPDSSYNLDFYVDFNGNGSYDVPPTDHAWRIVLDDIEGDTTITFTHNTNFTDIGLPVGDTTVTAVPDLRARGFSTFPNPVQDQLFIRGDKDNSISGSIKIFSATGEILLQRNLQSAEREVQLNVSFLKPGLYILTVGEGKQVHQQRFIKQ